MTGVTPRLSSILGGKVISLLPSFLHLGYHFEDTQALLDTLSSPIGMLFRNLDVATTSTSADDGALLALAYSTYFAMMSPQRNHVFLDAPPGFGDWQFPSDVVGSFVEGSVPDTPTCSSPPLGPIVSRAGSSTHEEEAKETHPPAPTKNVQVEDLSLVARTYLRALGGMSLLRHPV